MSRSPAGSSFDIRSKGSLLAEQQAHHEDDDDNKECCHNCASFRSTPSRSPALTALHRSPRRLRAEHSGCAGTRAGAREVD